MAGIVAAVSQSIASCNCLFASITQNTASYIRRTTKIYPGKSFTEVYRSSVKAGFVEHLASWGGYQSLCLPSMEGRGKLIWVSKAVESRSSTMTVSKAMEGTCVAATMNSSHYSPPGIAGSITK